MLYYIFQYLDKAFDVPGAGVFQFITFRSGLAFILSLAFATIYGKKIISFLKKQQVGETVRELGLQGQNEKAGTPTMGGIIIILATLIPVFLLARLENIYVILLIVTTIWMGSIGFLDDYIKIFKKDKEGLKGRFKVIGQVGLGIIVGSVLYFHPGVTVRKDTLGDRFKVENVEFSKLEEKSTATTIPFLKNNEFDYAEVLSFMGDGYERLGLVNFYSSGYFHNHSSFKWSQFNGWYRWISRRNFSYFGVDTWNFRFLIRKHHFLGLFEHYVYSKFRGNDHIYCGIYWSFSWISLV
jgi:phospho-N-acetylmuramoyl-pentapeptide-transferase